ncbi:MAG TPA: winged helix-turn-helix transcriptional regulator [Longimicrobiales bacterium]|nr:winged helix-turn-helix transcriptional regulator [Longimicrobiales bacterium]
MAARGRGPAENREAGAATEGRRPNAAAEGRQPGAAAARREPGANPRGRQPGLTAPGLGDSRRAILSELKRSGRATIPELSAHVDLNVETVREHVKHLASQALVRREGTRSSGPGRPEVVYALTADSERLFPRREGELLRGLARHLMATGHEDLLRAFFDELVEERRANAMARVEHLKGRERLDEAAKILSEQGFMAVVVEGAGRPQLRLCHCPFRDLVAETKIPCRAEIGLVHDLVGPEFAGGVRGGSGGNGLTRVSYIPSGDASCSYEAGR